MPEGDRRDERAEPDPLGRDSQGRQRREGVERRSLAPTDDGEIVVGAEQPLEPAPLARVGEREPLVPGDALLPLDHQAKPHRSLHHDATIALVRLAAVALLALALTGCGGNGGGSTAEGCADVDAPAAKPDGGATKPSDLLDETVTYTLVFETSCGDFEITLDQETAPDTAASLVALAKSGFYDDTTFHRVVPGFVIQGGDPTGRGGGGPGLLDRRRAAFRREVYARRRGDGEDPDRAAGNERQPVLRRHRRGCSPCRPNTPSSAR